LAGLNIICTKGWRRILESLMIKPNSKLSDQQRWSQPWSNQVKAACDITVVASVLESTLQCPKKIGKNLR
jgi:hypothetical protein